MNTGKDIMSKSAVVTNELADLKSSSNKINEMVFVNEDPEESDAGNRQESFATEIFEVESDSEVEELLVKFEKRFPFHTIHIEEYLQILFSLNKEKFIIEDLSGHFKGAQWKSQDF